MQYYNLSILILFALASVNAMNRRVTVINNADTSIKVTYCFHDVGFCGPRTIKKAHDTLRPQENIIIDVSTKVTPVNGESQCSYSLECKPVKKNSLIVVSFYQGNLIISNPQTHD